MFEFELECMTINSNEVNTLCDPTPWCQPDASDSCGPEWACLPTDD